MILIYAVDENWNIGYSGGMLVSIEEDLKRFRHITKGNIVVMGRKTLEAIPGQKALPSRINIVVTRNKDFNKKGIYPLHDLDNLDKLLEKIDPRGEMKVFITGGGSIVRQLIHRCNEAYITKILKDYKNTDTSVPDLDLDPNWEKTSESKVQSQGELKYKYVNYRRVKS